MTLLTTLLFNSLTLGPLALSSYTTPPSGIIRHLPTEGTITSIFGSRQHPILGITRHHDGVDIANTRNTRIFATSVGCVTHVGREDGYGLMIAIDHGGGWQSRYAHLARITVKKGDFVFPGAILGQMGATGLATGPHLHYELRRYGFAINPMPYLDAAVYTARN